MSPDPDTIRAARLAAGLTQTESASLIGASMKIVQDWESGRRNMPGAKWALWRINARHAKRKAR